MKEIKLVIAGNVRIICDCIEACLGREKGIRILGKINVAPESAGLVLAREPDILMMDVTGNVTEASDIVKNVKKVRPEIRVILLALDFESDFVPDMIREEVSGFYSWSCSPDEILMAVRENIT